MTHIYTNVIEALTTETNITESRDISIKYDVMRILQITIATSGIITNLAVIVVFVNDKTLRRKVPNICIINQVSTHFLTDLFLQ